LAGHIKILGITLDKHLTLDDHISAVCQSAYYHIRAIKSNQINQFINIAAGNAGKLQSINGEK